MGLRTADDPSILQWAADNDRILLTHDRATMKDFAGDRLASGLAMPGVLLIDDKFPVGPAIEELFMLCECSEHDEWNGRIVFLPL